MGHLITAVDSDSIAAELDIQSGYELLSIDGQEIADVFDYEKAAAATALTLRFRLPSGEELDAEVEKDEYEPLGLNFSSGLMSPVRSCKNHCLFCFIDQMPTGVRETLHVKDDDWRLSFIMGNYITLTNVDETEFERIIAHRISPLYISVHATDGELRTRLMRNPSAALIMQRLEKLKAAGLSFHCQIVVCPEINDGQVLENTLNALSSLRPAAGSVALVPVGLTRYRDGLYPLRRLSAEEAGKCIDLAESCNCAAGERFAFGADELYIIAGRELPPYESYGDFEQLENGVGLIRKFQHEFYAALKGHSPLKKQMRLISACGSAVSPYLQQMFTELAPYGIEISVHQVLNDYFGHSVTVSGLVTGGDIAAQLKDDAISAHALLIPRTMLRETEDVFLDGMTLQELSAALRLPVIPMPAADGEEFIDRLFDLNFIDMR